MTIELKIPAVGESIQEVQIGRWLKRQGDSIGADENVVELETDKASMELPAPAAGILTKIVKQEGESVSVGDVIAIIDEGADGSTSADKETRRPEKTESRHETKVKREKVSDASSNGGREAKEIKEKEHGESASDAVEEDGVSSKSDKTSPKKGRPKTVPATPSARRALHEHGLTAEDVEPEGDRLRTSDVSRHLQRQKDARNETSEGESERAAATDDPQKTDEKPSDEKPSDEKPSDEKPSAGQKESEKIVPMSLIRRRIARRLVEAQQSAALLTTFNEIDMTGVIELREKYKPRFQEKYGLKLGFMSFFVKAVIDGLRQFPAINAEIRDGDKIAYRNYFHIGIAVGGGQGLVVPVLFHAEQMSFAEIEQHVADFAQRAQQRKLKPEELEGGTFTISNGGVYGSLLSTPIVNPPQSGVLGMHAIQDRPVALNKQVVVRPMMYVALTYDHRLVDGIEAVSFLKRIRESIEDPARMLIEV